MMSRDDVDPELEVALRSHPQVVKSVGLYKVMGEGVQAIVGGAYHQFVSIFYQWDSILDLGANEYRIFLLSDIMHV